MKLYKMILMGLMALCISSICFGESSKKVAAVVEEFPNYIFHLQTLGNIVPEDPEYLLLYQDSVPSEDRAYLHEQRKLLGWGEGNMGPLTEFFVFIPGYINLQSQSEINEYFDSLNSALKDRNYDSFTKRYQPDINKIKLLIGTLDIAADLKSLAQYSDVVYQVGEIYKRNYPSYHRNVWPKEKVKLDQAAKNLNTELQKYDLITGWEKLTGVKFKTDDYQIVLYSANKNGPSANSLGYDRNAFYYGKDINMMVQFISHEVGTHLLIDDISQVMKMNHFAYLDVYQAFENMAEFYNVKFIFEAKPIYGYDMEKYYQIYTDLYNTNQNINHQDLMIKGLEKYAAQKKG